MADGGNLQYLTPNECQIYPLKLIAKYGDIFAYKEQSPFGWSWYFYPDGRIYFFTASDGPFLFTEDAKALPRRP
ncbi:hypothetical protein RBSWK_01421 [Rhodopirellula baltica SWK14]|uniref:Uncharacterized protein n=1 Tax=Rhodopirellula baltica SWK14 TaxID=993516 RepID=L7CK33_RHOBT|nr:hypothetical protein RBSWK_01421 [Rhodopirellula baltica SWK14]